jgi:hypothetical protein
MGDKGEFYSANLRERGMAEAHNKKSPGDLPAGPNTCGRNKGWPALCLFNKK